MTGPANALILIVEDEPAQRERLHYNLEAGGFRVARACDGEVRPDIFFWIGCYPSYQGSKSAGN